ncbi:hypothetical protein VM1G_05485 [Cytospora mali]|uniref:MARVEL domain-containing protein n=1 Tax=Cytospora mali TaxID=578113 RepID=A0A194W170_CYTMA|nr:hypothetical protein VM1G_05485 [Valsa mali]
MGWRLSSWLVLLRLFQLLSSFIPGAMNGWLLYHIYTNHLASSETMVILEILVATIFVYTSLSLLIMHTYQRSKRTAWMVCSTCFDVVFCFVNVAIVSILAFTGVPSNCSGLTSSILKKGDSRTLPALGYTTIGFSNEQDGHRGALDKYCGMEQAFYSIAIANILSYIITIVLSVLRICKLHLYSKEEVEKWLDDRESMIRLELKVHDPETPAQAPTTPVSNAPTTAVPTNNNNDVDRDLEAALAASAAPSIPRAMPSSSRSTLARPTLTETTLAGPSYQSRQPDILVSPVTPQFPLSPLSPVSPLTPLPPPAPPTTRTTSASTTLPIEAGFILSSTEMHANLAMITDGPRYSPQQVDNSHNQLPPYSPGNHRRMNGHGDESNEIRLSEYVKGATRAQDMKDEGGY